MPASLRRVVVAVTLGLGAVAVSAQPTYGEATRSRVIKPARVPPAAVADLRVVAPAPAPALAASVPLAARYKKLPDAEMAGLTRQVNAQLAGVIGARAVQPFKGALTLPSAAPGAAPIRLVPLALVDDPLRFDAASGLYRGRVAVGLVEVGSTAARALGEAVGFQILGDVSTSPEAVRVSSTAPPFAIVNVSARDPKEAVALRVTSSVAPEPVALSLPVERAALSLHAKPRLQGFGLETTDVVVMASDGALSRDRLVTLTLDKGSLARPQVTLDEQGSAVLPLRSESTGAARLQARSVHHQGAERRFDYDLPWRSLLAAGVGGIAGALLRGHGPNKRPSPTKRAAALGLGVLCGLLVYGLFVLGVNLLAVPLPPHGGEVLAAVVAALGAFFGSGLLRAAAPGR